MTLDFEGKVARWSGLDFQEKEPWLEIGTNYMRSRGVNFEFRRSCFSPDGRVLAAAATSRIFRFGICRGGFSGVKANSAMGTCIPRLFWPKATA
jgi:hypothetical protein